jgi:hypothetical protein
MTDDDARRVRVLRGAYPAEGHGSAFTPTLRAPPKVLTLGGDRPLV